MSHGRYIKPDVLSLAEFLRLTFGKVCSIICDDVVWKPKTENDLFEKLNRRGCITLADRLRFNPFSELVNCHQEVRFLSLDRLKGPTKSSPQTANGQVIGIILNS